MPSTRYALENTAVYDAGFEVKPLGRKRIKEDVASKHAKSVSGSWLVMGDEGFLLWRLRFRTVVAGASSKRPFLSVTCLGRYFSRAGSERVPLAPIAEPLRKEGESSRNREVDSDLGLFLNVVMDRFHLLA